MRARACRQLAPRTLALTLPPPQSTVPGLFVEAAANLRPGGVLLLRDYGAFDAAELRFRPGQRLGRHLFARSDGTLASFFTVEGAADGCVVVGGVGGGAAMREREHACDGVAAPSQHPVDGAIAKSPRGR